MEENELQKVIIANIKHLLNASKISLQEVSLITKIPSSTLYSIISGTSCDPRLSTIYTLSRFFGVNLSQLIGEIPLNWHEKNVPLLSWDNLNCTNKSVDFNIKSDTKFIFTQHITANQMFALQLSSRISYIYKENSILILELSNVIQNNDIVVISISNTLPVLKKIIVDGPITYLESVGNTLPLVEYTEDTCYIFGIMKELRSPF